MRRGDVVIAVIAGDYGKPRPAVVVQTDTVAATHPSVILCPVTSRLEPESDFRLTIEPNPQNRLHVVSQIMADKILTVRRERIRATIGRLEAGDLARISAALAFMLGLVE